MAHADQSSLNVDDPKCEQLAALHSVSVDFCKTGVPAQFPHTLKPKKYPHFMQKTDKFIYHSNKVSRVFCTLLQSCTYC